MSTMTLEQVREWHAGRYGWFIATEGGSEAAFKHKSMISAIDDYLSRKVVVTDGDVADACITYVLQTGVCEGDEPMDHDAMRMVLDDFAARINATAAVVVPEGWKLVPVEPTTEMLRAGFLSESEGFDIETPADAPGLVYKAMLAAAPDANAAMSNAEVK